MAEYVDEKVQDGNVLLEVVRKYQSELAEAGVTDEFISDFEGKIRAVVEKDTAQREAGNFIRQKTVEQNEQLKRAHACSRKIKTAAKDAFYGNSEMFKEFHIGGKSVTTVKGMLTELAYFKEKVSKRLVDLTNSGIKDADIAEIDDCMTSITSDDTDQENAKRLRTTATNERKAALKALNKIMFRVRKKADIRFADDADKRNEFRTIIVRRRKKDAEGESESESEE